jgi:hypothetical protein
MLGSILRVKAVPAVRIRQQAPSSEGTTAANHVLDVRIDGEVAEDPRVPQWVDNWVRLGLVEASYDRYFTDDGRYEWVDSNPVWIRTTSEPPARENWTWVKTKGMVEATAFGRAFAVAVGLEDKGETEPPA